jgi:hypothetical protein
MNLSVAAEKTIGASTDARKIAKENTRPETVVGITAENIQR